MAPHASRNQARRLSHACPPRDKHARLLTRTGLDWTAKYGAIGSALAKLPTQSAYIDGEVCAIQPDGTTSFAELQAATDHKQTARLFRV
jgi:ATP-dependent DNA ligase